MSNQTKNKTQQTEIKKSPFDQTFLCQKCSEILFTKICYNKNTNIPQVHFMCPQKHSGVVDLILFFKIFYSSNQEIENELSKFDEELEKDIEEYRNKKAHEVKETEEQKISNKSKSKEKGKNNLEILKNIENNNENENSKKSKNNIDNKNKENNNIDINIKLFKKLKKCNNIKFTLINDKENEITNSNIKKSKEKKANHHKITNNINIIKKINSSEKEEKIKEEKYLCNIHNKSHFIAYCHSCKKNLCKKCLKLKKHRCKMFKHIKINDNKLNELNKTINQCQESLNKFENKNKLLIESINLNNNEEKNEKIILYIMSKVFIEINREYLNEVKLLIKNYNNNIKNKMLNYEVIMSIKNIKIKNNMIIPNDLQELISIIRDYKYYLFENISSDNIYNNNKYLLFETFNEIINSSSESDNGKDIIKFSEIIENEKFRNLINLNDKDEEINIKNGCTDEKEIHEVGKIYDFDDVDEEMEYDEDEEFENGNEIEDYDDEINNEEDENNYGDDEDGLKDDEDKD